MTLTPRPYQIIGRDFLAGRRVALLADQMRVGKTPQAILAAHKLGARRITVLCPAIAVPQWEYEFRRWYEALGAAILPQIVVRSYDYARRHPEIVQRACDVAIIDEAHFARNPDAQRTKLVYGKNSLGWHAAHIWALSGTPMPNHPGELWPMLRAFGKTRMRYEDWVNRYCLVNRLTLRPIGTKPSYVEELRAMLATVMLRRTLAEVAPEMPTLAMDTLCIPGVAPDGDPNAAHLDDAALLRYLTQTAAHDAELRTATAMAKVKGLLDHVAFAIENSLMAQTIVFGHHIEPLRMLTDGLCARGISAAMLTGETSTMRRAMIQQDFRAGRISVVVANIQVAGTAVDFSAADCGFFLEQSWVPVDNLQAAHRIVSLDRKTPPAFQVVTWPGSFDERVQRVLIRKMDGIRAAGLA